MKPAALLTLLPALLLAAASAAALPLEPRHDDEVIETLPLLGGAAREQRELRRALAARPRDAATAVALSRVLLVRARHNGDARLAGQALGALGHWSGDTRPPIDVLLQRATVRQHLHDFDGAAADLDTMLRATPDHAQALLTLATVRRTQARYAASDEACGRLETVQPLYGAACRAENAALQGRVAPARARLTALLVARPAPPGWQSWLRTTLGELELRAGRTDVAIDHLQAAWAGDRDPYTRHALVDALIDARRWDDAQALLRVEAGDGDAVLLRRAIVARARGTDDAAALRAALADRQAQAARRPAAQAVHLREQARYALEVEADAARALVLARANLRAQREAADFVLMDRAARAAGDTAARAEVAALARGVGLVDARLGAES